MKIDHNVKVDRVKQAEESPDSPATKRRWRRTFETMSSLKERLSSTLSHTVHFQLGFDDHLTRMHKVYQSEDFKRLPNWAKSEIRGFESGITGSQWSPLNTEVIFAHLFEGKLYRDYDHWRRSFPELSGSALQDSCVQIWKSSGKIFYAGNTEQQKSMQGETFQFAE